MFGDLSVLNAEHVEPKRLMVLTVMASPRLAHVNDDHVVLTDHV
jgi:hypothetical protein